MSLYFKERVEEEQIEDPRKDMIKFCRSWILSIPPDAPGNFQISRSLITTSDINSAKWECKLTSDNFRVKPDNMWSLYFWNGSCYFSYKLYSDTEMRSEIYSSPRISLTEEQNSFVTPEGTMKEFSDAYEERKIVKMVIFVELGFPKLLFFRADDSVLKYCEDYPEDIDSDFRFEFLKDGDFTFKCLDGTVPALKMVMNVTALKKFLNKSNNDEFVLDHAVDVVQPIIPYIHSRCFAMPKFYDLDYADRILKAVKFFVHEEVELDGIILTHYFSLCEKFEKDPHNFELILQWASFATRHSISLLYAMVSTTIAQKYFYDWIERFPENTGIAENVLFGEIFRDVTNIFAESLSTKAILSLCNCVNCTK